MSVAVLTTLDLSNSGRIINVPAPVSQGDAINKQYVDSFIVGLSWKADVKVAVGTPINSVGTYSIQNPIQGVTLVNGDRVLLMAQSAVYENGIYVFSDAGISHRATDANTPASLAQATVTVEKGTYAGTTFRQSSDVVIVDTSAVTFVPFGSATVFASAADVNSGISTVNVITPAALIASNIITKKYIANVGDGTNTNLVVNHNIGTQDVTVTVYNNTAPYSTIMVDVQRTDVNNITLAFNTAPTTNQFRVIIHN